MNCIGQCIELSPITTKTVNILSDFYKTFLHSSKQTNLVKYTTQTNSNKIKGYDSLPFPPKLKIDAIPPSIKQSMHRELRSSLIFNAEVNFLPVQVTFVIRQKRVTHQIVAHYTECFSNIILWLHIILNYAVKRRTKRVNIYIYMMDIPKILPINRKTIIGSEHVNTAYTGPNVIDGEIVIYRSEEWFKVFIHETMHTFGVDFSDSDDTLCTIEMLKLFTVRSDVNLSEAYTEFWGRVMNILFFTFKKHPISMSLFIRDAHRYIEYQAVFSALQMNNILNFMGLTYIHLVGSKNLQPEYRENTSVLSYYIICGILMANYQEMLVWCKTNNKNNILQFTKTQENKLKFCNFIKKQSASPDIRKILANMDIGTSANDNTTLRMSLVL